MNLAVRLLIAAAGVAIVVATVRSAIRTLVLPRAVSVWLSRVVAVVLRNFFVIRMRFSRTYERKDRVMAAFGPAVVLGLAAAWLILVFVGYGLIYLALDNDTAGSAIRESGSALLTLGFATPPTTLGTLIAFTEAAIGLGLLAMLIAYLPVLYSAFADREKAVAIISVRAGTPPEGWQMLWRYKAIGSWGALNGVWREWESLFAGIEESHATFAVLSFFRSPEPNRSWITAAGAVLDAAALTASTVDVERDAQAELCIRAGFTALRSIASVLGIPYDPDPKPDDPISISRDEYDEACQVLEDRGVTLKADRDQAWRDFAGWRVNYDKVLIAICGTTFAPPAPWSSDRSSPIAPPLFLTKRKLRQLNEWVERPVVAATGQREPVGDSS